jgi:hypothetical protein
MQGSRGILREISAQLGKTALMPAAGKFRGHPDPDYIQGDFRTDNPAS